MDSSNIGEILNAGPAQKTDKKGSNLRARLFPQVIYASRTHSQLKQVVRELNKTVYRATTSVAFLAGRDQLCLNDKVKRQENSNAKSQMCRQMVHSRKCVFFNTLNNGDTNLIAHTYASEANGNVLDIEDLMAAGKKHQHCPFFYNRSLQPGADLILMPYNYILDPKIREAYNVDIKGNIIIFDEAHNLGKIAEESVSMSVSSTDIALCIKQTQECLEKLVEEEEHIRDEFEKSSVPFHEIEKQRKALKSQSGVFDGGAEGNKKEEYRAKKEDVAQLLDQMDSFALKIPASGVKVGELEGTVFPGRELIDILSRAGFTFGNAPALGTLIDKMGSFLMEKGMEAGHNMTSGFGKEDRLSDFAAFLSRVFSIGAQTPGSEEIYDLFQLYLTNSESDGHKFNFWCFSPKIAMRYLQNRQPLSIVLASGTLSPIKDFICSMGIGSNEYVQGVGEIISGLVQSVPQGMLVFFPSYSQMKVFLDAWKSRSATGTSRWELLATSKKLCVEPSSRLETSLTFREFDMAVREGRGAVMFAVCRGKMSEGIDFADCHCRAVVVVGIPYPPVKDPRVVLKKRFLTARLANTSKSGVANAGQALTSAEEWYKTEAIRAVNQAMGRIIRHRDDFGVVILADTRYATLAKSYYPAWIRPSFQAETDPLKLFDEIKRFFGERNLQVESSMKQVSMNPSSFVQNPMKRQYIQVEDEDSKKRKEQEQHRIEKMYSKVPSTEVKPVEDSRPIGVASFFTQPSASKPRRVIKLTAKNRALPSTPKTDS